MHIQKWENVPYILLGDILVSDHSLLGYSEMGKYTLYLNPILLEDFLEFEDSLLGYSEMGKFTLCLTHFSR